MSESKEFRKDVDATSQQCVVHATGAWTAMCDEARGKPRCLIVDKDDNEVAAVNPYSTSWNADADLIAAAPDLLEACVAFLKAYKTCDGDMWTAAQMAAVAVDKALRERRIRDVSV